MDEYKERFELIEKLKMMFGLFSQFGVVDSNTSLYKLRRIYKQQVEALAYLRGESHEENNQSSNQ